MRKLVPMAIAFLITVGFVAGMSQARPLDDTIKKVMKAAMKGGLCKTVASGKGTDDQKKELLELFQGLANATPPEGESDSWKSKTGALVEGAQAAVDGKSDAGAKLKKAANCKACHDAHKAK
jgi:surface antigen